MDRAQVLKEIIEVVDPLDELGEDTVISENDDLDSLALFNVMVYLRQHGYQGEVKEFSSCKTLGDIVSLIA
ncbi:MAG: hypothetical protein IJ228_02350 [Succinivibrio sp.]|nr:hypothetical protein [Succinivibrio sp.]